MDLRKYNITFVIFLNVWFMLFKLKLFVPRLITWIISSHWLDTDGKTRKQEGAVLCRSLGTRLCLLAAHWKQNSSTNCLCFQSHSSKGLQHSSHSRSVLSFSLILSLCVSPPCSVWNLASINMWHMSLTRISHHRSLVAAPTMHPIFTLFLPLFPIRLPLSHSPSLNIELPG